ncbi:MAG: hypothetical protein HOV80_24945, partial [Polyangiaceae bacterium]|nr:hypothetical protein [Polyangiaceae bacterium]
MRIGSLAVAAVIAVSLVPGVARAEEGSDLSFRFESEVTGYQDSDATSVLTPGVRADIEGVT